MDIFNRPPSISEDTLQYVLYPTEPASDKPSVTSLAACIHDFVDTLLPNFIWHRDAFELKVSQDPDMKSWFLEGRIRVGDCVDDEWCTVWLLRELSSKWDLVIGVFDSDGEFLLIEAAEEVPSWVEPANAENRLWIYNSHIHLIPLAHVSPSSRHRRRRKYTDNDGSGDENNVGEDMDHYLAVQDAVNLVRDPHTNTRASVKAENAVWRRISGYPAALREHTHTTKAYIPKDIAKALLVNPSLVQKAVETFYTRDALQLRAVHRMSRFPPSTNVLRSVKMTRAAYAQLIGQKFFPPKIFGQWMKSEGTNEHRWKDVGMKIAVGFEMLYQEAGRSAANTPKEDQSEANKDALRRNPDYSNYVQKLVEVGYFKGEKEGSQLWQEMETKAANAFMEARASTTTPRKSFAFQVDQAISKAASAGDGGLQEEDDDSWLTIDAAEFEDRLQSTMGHTSTKDENDKMDVDVPEDVPEEDRVATEQANRLKDLASKVEKFVEGEGDVEGARFEDDEFSDEEFSDDSDDQSDTEENRPDTSHDNRSAETQAAMDKLVPGLDPSEYGQMPASYYKNSQKVAPTTTEMDVVQEDIPDDEKTKSPEKTKSTQIKRPVREPILPRDKYDGVDSDDETDEEEEEDDESEEDKPQVVGDIEIDMGEEEEEFLEFTRQTLGISDDHWKEILQDREGRGAFIPKSAKSGMNTRPSQPLPPKEENAKPSFERRKEPRVPQPGPRPNVNPELDSFEAVMNAMDSELFKRGAEKKQNREKPVKQEKPEKGKGKAVVESEDEDEDIEAAMEAELKLALERGEDASEDEDEPMDYNMIKNFLESFKSQAGLSGPVSNLAGRLQPDFKLPRDDS